jgi:hypothetical protein
MRAALVECPSTMTAVNGDDEAEMRGSTSSMRRRWMAGEVIAVAYKNLPLLQLYPCLTLSYGSTTFDH